LQVEDFSRASSRFATLIVLAGAMLVPMAGCHRAPAPDVMATVNGKDILRSEVEKLYKASLADSPEVQSRELANIQRLNLLKGMIEDEILQQRAVKLNLAASDEDVNAKITEMKAPWTQEEWDNKLKQRNLTVDDLKRDWRRSLTKEKLLNKEIYSKINITDADISGYYTAHKSEFNVLEPQYHLAQIMVTGAPAQQTGNLQNNKASNDADAKKKIQTLHNRLESGEDFGAVAMQFSENPNYSSNGGDMGFVAESQLHADPDVYNAVSKLKPNQITEILPTYDSAGPGRHITGYAIYKFMGREPAGQLEMNDPRVQQTIRQNLREGHAQLLKTAYFEMLYDEAKVKNYFAEQILREGAK